MKTCRHIKQDFYQVFEQVFNYVFKFQRKGANLPCCAKSGGIFHKIHCIDSVHGKSDLRITGHHGYPYLDSLGQRLESQTEKLKKMIKNEAPSVLPDSAQGPSEGSNPILHSLGLGLGPLPYWYS